MSEDSVPGLPDIGVQHSIPARSGRRGTFERFWKRLSLFEKRDEWRAALTGKNGSNISPDSLPGLPPSTQRRGTLQRFFKRLSIFEALKILNPLDSEVQEAKSFVRGMLKDGFQALSEQHMNQFCSLPPQVVKFKDLTYTTQVHDVDNQFPTLGSVFLNTFFPWWRKGWKKKTFHILDNCTGYLMPGTLTLVCGAPGCGKTTLLKALCGQLVIEKGYTYSGTIKYNLRNIKDFCVHRISSYTGQVDRHLPRFTVREMLEFAYYCKNASATETALKGVQKQVSMEVGIQVFGLSEATAGDQYVRALSGGERRRATLVEMMADSYAAFYIDEFSTGQDSSTAYDLATIIRIQMRAQETTGLVTLLQPSSELFELMDRLIVLMEGQIIYQGPREDVLPYFARLGYVKPSNMDVADFLQEVTTSEGKLFLQPGFIHLDVENFVKAYKSSDLYREILRIVDDPKVMRKLWFQAEKPLGLKLRDRDDITSGKNMIEVSEVEPTGNVSKLDLFSQTTSKVREGDTITGVLGKEGKLDYIAGAGCVCFAADIQKKVSKVEGPVRMQLERALKEDSMKKDFDIEFLQDWCNSTITLLLRQGKFMIRNKSFIRARLFTILIISIVTGTIFYQVESGPNLHAMDLRKSLSFMACLAMAANLSQISNIIYERKVFEKHYAARFFRPNSYVTAIAIVQIPCSFLEIIVYCPLLYWLTGLSSANNGAHFIMFMLLAFEVALMGAAMIRFFASISRTVETAMAFAGATIMLSVMFSGFMVTKRKIPPWWIWAYYLSPLQYGVTGLICNEFLSGKYNQPCANSVPYCEGRMHMTIGQAYLDLYDMPTNYFAGVWIPVIALNLFSIALTCITFWSIGYLRFVEVKLPSAARLQQKTQVGEGIENASKDESTLDLIDYYNSTPPVISHSILHFEPILLSFHRIFYEVGIQGVKKPLMLLGGVSGYAKPGTMTALMGSSGAGKTTLLDVLAGRKTTGNIRGNILLNGYPKQQDTFARVSGYVEQNDIHSPYLTVHEALNFSATLRLPSTTSTNQRKTFVDEVTKMLELHDVQNRLTGSIGDSGLSIEEAKRLTIAVELVANPSIIFFDEPTSGLDSRSAQVVIRGIKKIVQSGRTAICTIHQPSRRLFLSFDQLLLLKRGGEVAYFGPIGPEARDLLGYFHALPDTKHCSANQNPATYILDLIGAGYLTKGTSTHKNFGVDYQGSNLRTTNWQELERIRHGKGTLGVELTARGYTTSWSTMIYTLLICQLKIQWRNVPYNGLRISFAIIVGLLLGTAFWKISYDNTPGFISRFGLVYQAIALMAIMTTSSVVPHVLAQRPVYYRETASNMYSSVAYSCALVLAEVPCIMFVTLLFCGICCSMAGVSTESASHFFLFWFTFYLFSCSLTYFGLCVALMTPNEETAFVIVSIIVNLWNITSGFFIAKKKIPSVWIWLYWVNPTQIALNALSTLAFYCDTNTPQCQSCSLDPSTGSCPSCDCVHIQDQNELLAWLLISSQQDLARSKIPSQILILSMFAFGFHALATLALRFMRFHKR